MVRHSSKFACSKRNPNVTHQGCLLPSKRKRENKDDAWLSQIDPSTVMKLVHFRPVSWIWEKRDYISQLPDDILINILSRLTMEERAGTSILSSRWRHLWTSVSGILEFDNSSTIKKILSGKVKKPLSVEHDRFAKYVNQVLEFHHNRTVKELKICFDVNNAIYTRDINSWIKFAIQKGVKRFQLDLTNVERNNAYMWQKRMNGDNWEYIFPSYYLGSSTSISLTALHLKYVQVTEEVINNILRKCPLLEVLSIVDSSLLKNLKVCGSSLKLKYLEIITCDNVKNIEVSAKNLVSFKYRGRKLDINLVDVPSLNEVSFGGHCGTYLVAHRFQEISSRHLSQLETLRLEFRFERFLSYHNFPQLCKLKQLHLTVYSINEETFLSCISLIEASPLLHRFSLQFECSFENINRTVNQKAVKRHQSLKVVELIGFKGVTYELVLAKYLLEYAKHLEKIIIDPYKEERGRISMYLPRLELESLLPPNAKLMIL